MKTDKKNCFSIMVITLIVSLSLYSYLRYTGVRLLI